MVLLEILFVAPPFANVAIVIAFVPPVIPEKVLPVNVFAGPEVAFAPS